MSTVESRLTSMGLILPDPLVLPSPNRTSAVQVGNMLYVSGHGAALLEDDTVKRRGKVDVDISEDEAYATSRALALKMIATVVKILGMINSHPDFERPNAVLNGASDLIYEAFGPEIGQHARSSVGVETLVDRQPVEIEGIFLIQD